MSFNHKNHHSRNHFQLQLVYRLLQLQKNKEKGTVLTLAVILGLLMIGVSTLSMTLANNSNKKIIADQGNKQALSVTEAGISKSLSVFQTGNNNYMLLADFNGTTWTAPVAADLDFDEDGGYGDDIKPPTNACGDPDGDGDSELITDALEFIEQLVAYNNSTGTLINDIQGSGIGNGLAAGTYEILTYDYDSTEDEGKLEIRGRNSTNTSNQAQYEVNFDVTMNNSVSPNTNTAKVAALMAPTMDTKGMPMYVSTAICTNPSVPGNCGEDLDLTGTDSIYCSDGILGVDSSLVYGTMTSAQQGEYNTLEEMLGATSGGKFKSPNNQTVTNILIQDINIPEMPEAPAGTQVVYVNATNPASPAYYVTTASAYDPSTTVASAGSFSLTSANLQDQKTNNFLASTFNFFQQWFNAPALAAPSNINIPNNNQPASSADITAVITEINTAINTTIPSYIGEMTSHISTLENYLTAYPTIQSDIQTQLTEAESALTAAQQSLTDAQNALTAAQVTGIKNNALRSAYLDTQNALANAENHEDDASDALTEATQAIASISTTTTATSGANADLIIDVSQAPYNDKFVTETIGAETYHAIYIELSNASSADDIRVVIDDTALTALGINPTKLIIRVYMPENYTAPSTGNAAIEVVEPDGAGGYNRIDGNTDDERKKIASFRLIGAKADGSTLTDKNGAGNLSKLTWDMSGTGCLMAMVHALEADVIMPAGNGCGSSGGSVALDLNSIMADDYSAGSYTSMSGGPSNSSPNIYGVIWAMNVTNNNPTSTGSFYENTSLTTILAAEFGDSNPEITGISNDGNYVKLGERLLSFTRKEVD
jgi:hypothetical protein